MFTTFTVQPLLRGVHLDDSPESTSRSHLDRPAGAQPGSSSPGPKSSGIFHRNSRPMIESMDSFENNLYVGTSDGYLLHYSIEEQISSESDLPKSRLVRRKFLGFGKKLVERISVIASLRIAIVLCDSTLSFFTLPDFSPCPIQTQPPIKGVTAFCEDTAQRGETANDGSVRLCVTKRRIIQFYSLWEDGISEAKELSLPNGALVVTRWSNFVCVADANDFKLIDCRVGRMIPVLPVVQSSSSGASSQVLKPVCIAIADNEFLLASATSSGQTAIGIFCSGGGDPVRGTLQWSGYPRALGVEFPYVAALLRNNIVEIHNILDQRLIQTIRFDPAMEIRTLVQGPGLAVWMSTLASVLTTQGSMPMATDQQEMANWEQKMQQVNRISSVLARVLVAGKENISALVTTPLVLHADDLLQKGRVEEALLLSEKALTTMSSENLHRERLQHELDFIYQKSGLIYLGETLFDDAFGLLQKGKVDPRVPISMFPDVLQEPGLLRNVELYRGVRDVLHSLGSLPDLITKTMSKSGNDEDADFRHMLLTNAKEVLLQFLLRYRKDHTKVKGRLEPGSVATDTALVGLWVDNGDSKSLYQLLGSAHSCNKDLVEQKLKSSNKHYALSIWHKSQKNFRATLGIWKSLLLGELQDSDSDLDLQGIATLLLSIQDVALVEEYGWWVVEQDEDIGLKIFMPGDAKRAAMFEADKILQKCRACLSQEGIVTYLEYVVLQRKSENPEYHTSLCALYVDRVLAKLADSQALEAHIGHVNDFSDKQRQLLLASETVDLISKVVIRGDFSNTFTTFLHSGAKSDPIASSRAQLVHLLQTSLIYDASAIFSKVDTISTLKLERAILLTKLSRFEEAIHIMVADVNDYQGVELLCLHSGSFPSPKRLGKTTPVLTGKDPTASGSKSAGETLASTDKRRRLFMILLKEYLQVPHDQGGMVLSLRLLNSQSSDLDISNVIDLLPSVWSVELLQQYLLRSLRRNYHEFKQVQVVKGLSLGENLRISEELYQLYKDQGPVVITADDICHVCGSPVADAVFQRTVDMRTVHLHCGSDQAESMEPATKTLDI